MDADQNERMALDADIKEIQGIDKLINANRGPSVEEPQRFKRRQEKDETKAISVPGLGNSLFSREGNAVKAKVTLYSKEPKNIASTLTELRVQDSPLKNGGGDNEKHYEKFMQKELDKRFDMEHAKNLLLEQPKAAKVGEGQAPVVAMARTDGSASKNQMGGKALKKNVEKFISNLIADQKKITSDGRTLQDMIKMIHSGTNVETVKKAICDGTDLEPYLNNQLTKNLVKYFNDNKERTQKGKLPAHQAPTYIVTTDLEQGIYNMLQASVASSDFQKKQDPYDRVKPFGNSRVDRIQDALRADGLNNPNDHKYSKVNAHTAWFDEKRDRKVQPTFKDNTSRHESNIYDRGQLKVNPKFYDPDFKHVKPTIRSAYFVKEEKTEVRDKVPHVPKCLSKFVLCTREGRAKTDIIIAEEAKAIAEAIAAAKEEARLAKERAEGNDVDLPERPKAEMVVGPVSWKAIIEPGIHRVRPPTPRDIAYTYKINTAGPIGFDKQPGHSDINKGNHYCPVDENRFTQTTEMIMPKNVTKYKDEIVHTFGRVELPNCEVQINYKNVQGKGWVAALPQKSKIGDKDRSTLWPTKKEMDPFYIGTGKEKFYDSAAAEYCKPSLHNGFHNMKKQAGRGELVTRNDISEKAGAKLHYEPDAVRNGQHMLSTFKQGQACVPFSSQQPRDDQQFGGKKGVIAPENQIKGLSSHGQSQMSTTNMSSMSKASKNSKMNISFQDFLPNSIKNAPGRRAVSHSFTTQRLRLGNTLRTNVLSKPFIPGEEEDVLFQQETRFRKDNNIEMGSAIMMSDNDIVERNKFEMAAVNQSVGVNEEAIAMFNSEVGAGVIASTMMMSQQTDRYALASQGGQSNNDNAVNALLLSGSKKKRQLQITQGVSTKAGSDYSGFNYKHDKSPKVLDSILDHQRDYFSYQKQNAQPYTTKGNSLGQHAAFKEKIAI